MFGHLLIEKMPGKWTARLLAYVMPVSLLVRYLITSVGGTLSLALLVYWIAPILSDVQPWALGELLIWIDELPIEAKTGIFTSFLTVIGFLVAFRSATEAWKGQAFGEIKLKIAAELDTFSNEAANLITDMRIVAEHSLDAVKSFRASGANQETIYLTEWAIERGEKFKVARERLSSMSVEINRIVGNNSSVLMSLPGATSWMDKYISALRLINKKMWIFIPIVPVDPTLRYAHFSSKVNVTAYEDFIACCKDRVLLMSGLIGGVRGALLQGVVPANFHTYLALRKHRKLLPEAFSKLRDETKSDKKSSAI